MRGCDDGSNRVAGGGDGSSRLERGSYKTGELKIVIETHWLLWGR